MRKLTINHSYVKLFLKITFQTIDFIPKLYILTELLRLKPFLTETHLHSYIFRKSTIMIE